MRAGRMTSTIVIERRTEILDAAGTPVDARTPVLKTRAEIITIDARTFLAEAGEQTEHAAVFRIRYREGIEPGDFVLHDGRELQLVELKEVRPRFVLELRCQGSRL